MSKEITEEVLANIKLVCTDVDGTLVEEGKADLNPEYFDEIRRLAAKGIRFAVVSGRGYEATRPLFEEVIEDVIFINDNGAAIRFQDTLLKEHTMDYELVLEIVRDIEARAKGSTYISSMTGSYAWKGNQKLCDILRNDFKLQVKELERMPEDLPRDAGVMGVALYHPVDCTKAAGEAFITKWNAHEQISAVSGGNQWFNINQKHVNKGSAIKEVMEQYGLTPDQVIAFGDNMNDLTMLQSVTHSFAIGNARKEVKEVARYTADTYQNDGVLQILKKL